MPAPGLAATLAWKFSTGALIRGTPALVDQAVIVASFNGRVFALDKKTGKQVWQFRAINAIASAPVVAGQNVYLAAADHFLYALNSRNGRVLWRFYLKAPGLFPPTVSGDTVLVGGDRNLYALDAASGNLRWSRRVPNSLASSLLTAGNRVYASTRTNTLYAWQLSDGREVWAYNDPSAPHVAPALERNLLLWASVDGRVLAMDGIRGRPMWQFRSQGEPLSQLSLYSQLAILAIGNDLLALDALTGLKVWKVSLSAAAAAGPVGQGRYLYSADRAGVLYRIRLADGNLLARYESGQRITTAPAIEGDRLIFGTADGYVYALEGFTEAS